MAPVTQATAMRLPRYGRCDTIGRGMIDESVFEEAFYVVAREAGHERAELPAWADRRPGNVAFGPAPERLPRRRDVAGVPGAFQLLDVLSEGECAQLVAISGALGYHADAPVSLPHHVRHNANVNWIVDESIDGPIWERCRPLIPERVAGGPALGLNARFRFYRYREGDYFRPHSDGAWPGSRVVDGRLVHDAYRDRISQMSMLLFLSDGYTGGRTLFYVPGGGEGAAASRAETEPVGVSTPKGAALCFPHGFHPLHCLHAGEPVGSGTKVIIRTDVLFALPEAASPA